MSTITVAAGQYTTTTISTAGFALGLALLGTELWRWHKGGAKGGPDGGGGKDPKALIPLGFGIVCGILMIACPAGLLGALAGFLRWGGNSVGDVAMKWLTGTPSQTLGTAATPRIDGYGAIVVAALAVSLFLLMAPTLFFFYWMISLSLKTDVDNLANPPVFLPRELTLKNYAYVFQSSPLPRFAVNSVVVGVGSTALALLLGVPAGYGIARSRRYGMALLILVARITPALSFLIPWFLLFQQLGLSNTYHALIVSHLVIGLPLVMWIMMGFFEGVHPDLEDAALIDGCSRFGSFLRVALPLTSSERNFEVSRSGFTIAWQLNSTLTSHSFLVRSWS